MPHLAVLNYVTAIPTPMTVSKPLSSIGSLPQAVSISLTLKESGATFILYQKSKKMFTYHVHIKNNVYTSQLYNYFKRKVNMNIRLT